MPRIPTFDTNAQINPIAPAVERSYEPSVETWQSIGGLAKTGLRVSEKFKRARATQEAIDAALEGRRIAYEMLDEAKTSNVDEVNGYYGKIINAHSAILNKIKDPLTRQEVGNDLRKIQLTADLKLRDLYRRKVIEQGKLTSDKLDNQFVIEYTKANNDIERKLITESYLKGKRALLEAGIISQKEFKNVARKASVMVIEKQILDTPYQAIAEINKMSTLKDSDPKLYEKLRNKAYSELRRRRSITDDNLMRKFIMGQATFADVASEFENGNLSERQFAKWQKRLKTAMGEPREVRTEPNPEGFSEVMATLAKGENVSLDALYDEKKLTLKELADVNNFKTALETLPEANKNAIISYIKQVDGLTNSPEAKANIYHNLLTIAEQAHYDTDKIKETINKTERERLVTKYPTLAKLDDMPDVIVEKGKPYVPLKFGGKKGGTVIYFPDKDAFKYSEEGDVLKVLGDIYDGGRTKESDKAMADLAKKVGKWNYVHKLFSSAWQSMLEATDSIADVVIKGGYKLATELNFIPIMREYFRQNPPNWVKFYGESAENRRKFISALKEGEKGLSKFGLEMAGGTGAMIPDLIQLLTVGGAMLGGAKMIGVELPKILGNRFVMGTLTESVVKNTLNKDKDPLQKIETIAGDFASSYAIVNAMPAIRKPLQGLIARALTFGAYGTAHANYQSLVERGKPLSFEENKASIAENIGMGMAFETMGLFHAIRENIIEKKALRNHIEAVAKYLNSGDMSKIAQVFDNVEKDPDIFPDTKEIVNKARNIIGRGVEITNPRDGFNTGKLLPYEQIRYERLSRPGAILTKSEQLELDRLEKKAMGIKYGGEIKQADAVKEPSVKTEEPIVPTQNISISEKESKSGKPEIAVEGLEKFPEIPNATKSLFKNIAEKIPTFQGSKRKMFPTVAYLVDKTFTPEQKARVRTIVDLFGGSGGFGKALAEAVDFPNLKRVVINELSKNKVLAIKYIHERGNLINQDLKEINPILEEIDAQVKRKGTTSGSSYAKKIAEYIKANKDNLSDRQIGLLQHLVNRGLASYGNKTEGGGIKTLENLLELAVKDAKEFKSNSDILKARGVNIEIRKGDAYELGETLDGRDTLAIADPPYYMTTGYTEEGGKSNKPVDAGLYKKTYELVKHLHDKGIPTIYTDEAWWHKKQYTPDYKQGKEILDNVLKLGHTWYSDKLAGTTRHELLGVYNGEKTEPIAKSKEGAGASATGADERGEQHNREGLRGSSQESRQPNENNGEGSQRIILPKGYIPKGAKSIQKTPELLPEATKEEIPTTSKEEPSQNKTKIGEKAKYGKTTELHAGLPLPKEFRENTLKPMAETITSTVSKLASEIKDQFYPEARVLEGKKASYLLRKALAERARKQMLFEKESNKRWDLWNNQSAEQNLNFIRLIERGEKTGDETIDKLITSYRKILDEAYDMSKSFNDKISYVKDYFPHIWKNEEQAKEFFNKFIRNLGKEGFSKERYYKMFDDALEAGLKPKFRNVEDYILNRYSSALTAKMKADMLDYLEKEGLLTKEKKENLSNIITPKGTYYGDPAIIKLLDRKFKNSWFTGNKGWNSAARGALGAKNATVISKLSFSGFHALFTTTIDLTNQGILAAKSFGRGNVEEGLKRLATIPASPFKSFKIGKELQRAYLNPQTPEEQYFVKVFTDVGGRIKMPDIYRIKARKAFKEALAKKDYLGAGIRGIPRALEMMQKPLLDVYVPRLKLAKFWLTFRDWEANHPNATYEQKIDYGSKLWDSIDNRLGELTYDNLFWNRMIRDAGVITFLSLGWQTGSVREAGGAVKDAYEIIRDMVRGIKGEPHYVDRLLFVAIYPFITAVIGGTIHTIMTGHLPKKLIDYFYPEDGDGGRLTNPAYTKDYFSIGNAIRKEGLLKGLGMVASHKAAPLWSFVVDLIRNRDFYNVMIRDPRSPAVQQAKDIGKFLGDFLLPISVSSAKREKGLRKILPFLGLSKAPSFVSRTYIQNKIYDLLGKHYRPAITRTEWERKQKERELVKKLKDEKADYAKARREIIKAMRDGILGEGDTARRRARRILKNLTLEPDVVAFSYLTPEEQTDLWNKMTDGEKVRYFKTLHKKIRSKLLTEHIRDLLIKKGR